MIKLQTFKLKRISAGVLATLICACDGSYTDAELVQRAKEFQAQGNNQAAIIELKNASVKNPENAEARWLLANLHMLLGEPASAEKEVRQAMVLGLPVDQGLPLEVKALLLQGKFKKVLKIAENIPDNLTPVDRAAVLAMIGQAFIAQNDMDKAAFFLEQALEVDPASFTAHLIQADWYGSKGQRTEAREWNRRAMAIDDSVVEAWSQLGQVELDSGNYAEAEAAFSKAIELSAYVRLDVGKRAFSRMMQDNYEAAELDLNKLIAAGYGHFPYTSYLQGLYSFRQGDYAAAEVSFGKVVQVLPSHLSSKVYLTTALLAQKEYEQARVWAEQVVAGAPTSSLATQLMGTVFIGRSDYVAAEDALKSSLQGRADDVIVLRMLGTVALVQGKTADSVQYFQQAASLIPNSAEHDKMLLLARMMNGEVLEEDVSGADYDVAFLYAVNLFQRGELGAALKHAQGLHKTYPEKVDILNLIAGCYLVAADWENARPPLEKALAMAPDNSTTVISLAKVEIMQERVVEARQLLSDYLLRQPVDGKAIVLLSELELQQGEEAEAERRLLSAHEAYPNNARVLLGLVRYYFNTGDVGKTLQLTTDMPFPLVEKEPGLMELRGKSLMRSGRLDEAVSSFQRWVEVSPKNARAQHFYADSLAWLGRTEGALNAFDRAIKLDPNYLLPRIGEARIFLQENMLDKAEFAVAEIRKLAPDAGDALWVDGWLALLQGDFPRAEKMLTGASAQLQDSQLTLMLATALWKQDKHEQALVVMQERLQQHPNELPILLEVAARLLHLQRESEAREIYRHIVDIYPRHVLALNNLAFLLREDDLELALSYAERAYELLPEDPTVLDTLGSLLISSGDSERAVSLLQQAVSAEPNNAEFNLHLAQAQRLLDNGS